MGGHVVQARGGDRHAYAPWISPLAGTSEPLALARALLEHHPFPALYLADLDAIMGRGDNWETIAALAERHPELALWVDRGPLPDPAMADWPLPETCRPVLGTESLSSLAPLERATSLDHAPILSLDFGKEGFRGPPDILRQSWLWPDTVIAMTLARVGSGQGPDLDRFQALRDLAPDRHWYAAGGIRGDADLEALRKAGAEGVLVASALHAGRLTL